MVKVNRSLQSPACLSKKRDGCWREQEVIERLETDFHRKCYLCECEVMDLNVEHLVAREIRPDLAYDWDNLFFSCCHCNNVKNQSAYKERIMDCCKTDPETVLNHDIVWKNNKIASVNVTPVTDSPAETECLTANLLNDCFNSGSPPTRAYQCRMRIETLASSVSKLLERLDQYEQSTGDDRLVMGITIGGMLDRSYPFAGFLRTYVRENIEKFPDLEEYVKL